MSEAQHEKRKDPRLDNNIPIRIRCGDGDVVTETKNLSRSGTYCRVNAYIEPMTKLKLQLLVPIRKNGKVVTKKVACQGVVVRSEAENDEEFHNIAIFFNDISQRDAECIADYVSSHLEQES